MACIKYLILFVLFTCNVAFAGYAQLKPPPGWSQGLGAAVPGRAGVFNFGPAANLAIYKGSTVLTNAALSVAGQSVVVPVAMRLAANAPKIAAGALFLSPQLRLLAGMAGWLGLTKLFYDEASGLWKKPGGFVTPYNYSYYPVAQDNSIKFTDGVAACNYRIAIGGYTNPTLSGISDAAAGGAAVCTFTYQDYFEPSKRNPDTVQVEVQKNPCPLGTIDTGAGCRSDGAPVPVTQPEFEESLSPYPMPKTVPYEIPNTPLPLEVPVLNPNPLYEPLPAPAPALAPRPLFIPTGNPVPTPDPAVWNQPGVRVSPAPTLDNPWRVDVTPEDIPQTSATPKTDAELNPSTSPAPVGTPKPAETPGLCDMYPDILACQKMDTPESDNLETKDKTIAITPDVGWGSAAGSCPAPRHFSKGEFSFQIYCDFASGIKPVIIAVAWLVAAGILIGFKFGES